MLILAPTTTAQNNHNSIQPTIRDRIIALQSGNIQGLYQTAMGTNQNQVSGKDPFFATVAKTK
jgi:hypothetical protein